MAHAFVDAIADTGANAVKFQTHVAAAESTREEPWRVRFSPQDDTRYEYWRRMEFSEAQWDQLRRHAQQRGLIFLSSPFSIQAVELLQRVGVTAWKVASGELGNLAMFDRMVATGLPMLLSTGMSALAEIDAAVARAKAAGADLAVLQCTSAYPCPPEKVGLNLIPFFRDRYECPIGLSDHSGTIFPAIAAVTLGADMIEVHVTLSREMPGPDVPASVTTAELKQLVAGVRFTERILDTPVDKDLMAGEMAPLRALFTKSVAPTTDLEAGTILRAEHLTTKKPGTGISPARLPELLGRRLRRSLKAHELLRESDLERAE